MPKTLLLADDSVVIQKLVGLSFANEDINLVTTHNGDEALARAREVAPDLVLADVVMPGKNGYEVCAAIKSDPQLCHVPVLLLTGTFEAFDDDRARQVGSDGHITKPFEAQGLVDRVMELLARAPQPGPATAQAPAPEAPKAAASAAPQAPRSSPEQSPPVASAAPAASGDDAFDFFDDDVAPLAAAEQPAMSPPMPGSASEPRAAGLESDPLSSLARDPLAVDGSEGADILKASFDLEPEGPNDLTRVVMSPTPAAEGPPPSADDMGATRVALDDDDLLGDNSASGAGEPLATSEAHDQPASGWQGEAMIASPGAGDDPTSADDLFGETPAVAAVSPPLTAPAAPMRTAPDAPTREPAFVDGPVPITTANSRPAGPRIEVPPESAPAEPNAAALAAAFDLGSERAASAPPQKSDYDVSMSDLGDSSASLAASVAGEGPGAASRDASPEMRDRIHETLEKVAWEAFADLSDTIVRKVLQRVESAIWEIVPQMAETLIQEEIRRMKGEG